MQYGKLKSAVGLGPNEQVARQYYLEGYKLFTEKKYKAAAEQFKAAADRGPNSPIEQDAMFMIAESYFYDDRYIPARDAYDALVKKHTNTRYMDKVIEHEWQIARYWEQYENAHPDWPATPNGYDKSRPWFDTVGHAIKTYENIRLNDPTGPLADDAIMAMGNSYFLRGRYGDADLQYELLRKEYPRSDHQYDAHILGLQCKLRKYQGPDYDGTPLEESQVLVKQLKVQFSGQLDGEQRERLAEVDAMLKKEIATRDFQMAQHFDGIEEYGSARMYYARVMKEYPQTPLAEQSKVRLAEIGGEPERPTSMFEPVLELLPENSERTKMATVPLVKPTESPIGPVRTDIMTAFGQNSDAGQGGGSNDPTIRR